MKEKRRKKYYYIIIFDVLSKSLFWSFDCHLFEIEKNIYIGVNQKMTKVFSQCNEDTVLNQLEFQYTVVDYTHENFGAYFSNRGVTNILKVAKALHARSTTKVLKLLCLCTYRAENDKVRKVMKFSFFVGE